MEALRSSFLHSSPFNSKPLKLKTHPPTILCCLKRDPWSLSSGNMNIPKPKSINPFPNDNTRRIIKAKAQNLSALRRDQGSRIQTPKWIKRTLEQMVPYMEEDRIGHLYGRHVVPVVKRVLSISGMREGEYDMREVTGSFVAKLSFREMYVVLKEQKSWRQVMDFFQWMKLQMDGVQEPLLKNDIRQLEDFSVVSAIFPFLFPAFGGLLFGYDIGATSSATISIQSETLSGISWFNLSSLDVGLITSGSLYGALIGSILAFNIADFLGRRGELVLSSVMYLIGALLTALAPNFALMVIGRLIFGVGIGLAMHAAPIYIAETAPSQIRGLLISLKECFIVLGVLGGYVAGSLLVDTVSGWRYVYGISFPLSIIMGIGMWWLPESPRWILLRATQGKGDMQGLRETAITCLGRLRGEAIGDSAPQKVDEILSELSYLREQGEATFSELFQGKCLKALTIGGGLVLFQQITGQPSVLYYAATIFQSAGFSAASDATKVSVLLGVLKLTMTGLAVLVVDRLGRRPLLLGGVSGIVLSLFLLGSYYTYLNDIPALAVVALLVYVGCYQISFGPIGWLMISEIFPLRLRGRGLSIAVLINFGANALVTFAFSPLKELLGAGNLFFIFGGIAVLSLIFIFFVIPETKGLTLEEIEDKLL